MVLTFFPEELFTLPLGGIVMLPMMTEPHDDLSASGIKPKPLELAKTGRREGSSTGDHALAGITVENATNQSEKFGRSKVRSGVVVTDIEPDSPAERGGLRTGDIIREINRKPVNDVRDFERITNQLSPTASVLLLLNRGNATIFISINPGK